MKTADYMLLQGIAYATDIGKRGSLPYRPLVSLPSVSEQFDKFFGVNAQADAQPFSSADTRGAQRYGIPMPEISTGHPTQPTRKDAQPSRAVSPNPATFAPDPPDWDYFNRHSYAELTGGY